MSLSNSKKSQVHNYMAIVIFLLIFGFLTILSMTLFLGFKNAYVTTGYYVGDVADAGDNFEAGLKLFDKITLFMLVILIIGVGVSSFRLATSKVAFIVSVVLIPFMGFVSYFFNYIFLRLIGDAAFAAVLTFFPITILICTNLHWVAIFAAIVGSITLYAKRESPPETLG